MRFPISRLSFVAGCLSAALFWAGAALANHVRIF